MRNIFWSNQFLKTSRRIPKIVLVESKEKILPLLAENFMHPLLHTKKLSGALEGFYSARVAHEYRVIFIVLENGDIRLHTFKHRKDAYKK